MLVRQGTYPAFSADGEHVAYALIERRNDICYRRREIAFVNLGLGPPVGYGVALLSVDDGSIESLPVHDLPWSAPAGGLRRLRPQDSAIVAADR